MRSDARVINVKGKDYIVYPPTVGYHYVNREFVGYQVTYGYRTTRDGKPFGPSRWVGTANPGKGIGAALLAAAAAEFGMDQAAYDYMVAEFAANPGT